jgi:hypothetical protein
VSNRSSESRVEEYALASSAEEVIMANCVCCGAETQLYVNDQPICLKCVDSNQVSEGTPGAKNFKEQPKLPAETGVRPFDGGDEEHH